MGEQTLCYKRAKTYVKFDSSQLGEYWEQSKTKPKQ